MKNIQQYIPLKFLKESRYKGWYIDEQIMPLNFVVWAMSYTEEKGQEIAYNLGNMIVSRLGEEDSANSDCHVYTEKKKDEIFSGADYY